MTRKSSFLVHSSMIAALYVLLTHFQYVIWPDSTFMPVQFRLSEMLCVLSFFTPAAIPGLAVGCMLFNLTCGFSLPFDFLVGALASLLAAGAMWMLRNVKIGKLPVLGLTMPAVFNGLLVGLELTLTEFIGGSFWINAALVAAGELAVLFSAGALLYWLIRARHLDVTLRL